MYDEDANANTINDWKSSTAYHIRQFLRRLFSTALLGPECAIVALVGDCFNFGNAFYVVNVHSFSHEDFGFYQT